MSNGQRQNQNYTQCNYINDIMRIRVMGNKTMKILKWHIYDKKGSRQNIDMEATEELRKNILLFESIPESIRL
jgi:hypothetical protein